MGELAELRKTISLHAQDLAAHGEVHRTLDFRCRQLEFVRQHNADERVALEERLNSLESLQDVAARTASGLESVSVRTTQLGVELASFPTATELHTGLRQLQCFLEDFGQFAEHSERQHAEVVGKLGEHVASIESALQKSSIGIENLAWRVWGEEEGTGHGEDGCDKLPQPSGSESLRG